MDEETLQQLDVTAPPTNTTISATNTAIPATNTLPFRRQIYCHSADEVLPCPADEHSGSANEYFGAERRSPRD